jgi:Fe-Mn family superoxide dismutase
MHIKKYTKWYTQGVSSLNHILNPMTQFQPKTFSISALVGISQTNIDEHLKLYQGYVKHANLILEKIEVLSASPEENAYVIGELRRRFGFEFCGMKNHEYYFTQFEGAPTALATDSELSKKINATFDSFENWQKEFNTLAMTRGVGWAMLYQDGDGNLLNAWVDEQHLGQLATCTIILALDMWEHAFVYDYPTSEKKKYVEAFFKNLNWSVVEARLK